MAKRLTNNFCKIAASASNADSRPTNRDMLECVHKIMNDSNKHSEDVYGFLRDLLLTKQKMLELHDLTKEHLKKIGESKEQIKSFQRQKQEDMWSFIRQALRSRRASSGATSPTPAFQTSLMMTQTSMETSMAINEYQNLSSSLRRMESANSLHGTGEWSMLERIDES